MLKFVIQLFEPKQQETPKRKPRPLRLKLTTSDAFGKALQNYIDHLPAIDSANAEKVFRLLMYIGSDSEPPKNWHRILNPQKVSISIEHVQKWWRILTYYGTSPQPQHKQNYQLDCNLSTANIPIARGIIWLYIHLEKAKTVTSILEFISSCQDNAHHRPLISSKLAHAALDDLIRQPFFKQKKRDVLYFFPNLDEGRIGKKLQQYWKYRE